MKVLSIILIVLAILSIAGGVVVKLLGLDLSAFGFSDVYPFRPQSFIDFADTLLLLAIAFIGLSLAEKQE